MKTLGNSIAVLNGSKVEFVNERRFEQTASMKAQEVALFRVTQLVHELQKWQPSSKRVK